MVQLIQHKTSIAIPVTLWCTKHHSCAVSYSLAVAEILCLARDQVAEERVWGFPCLKGLLQRISCCLARFGFVQRRVLSYSWERHAKSAQHTKTRGRRGVLPPRWVVSFTLWPLYPLGSRFWQQLYRRQGEPLSLFGPYKRREPLALPRIEPCLIGRPVYMLVTILTTVFLIQYNYSKFCYKSRLFSAQNDLRFQLILFRELHACVCVCVCVRELKV
jgi:hypothetical protein